MQILMFLTALFVIFGIMFITGKWSGIFGKNVPDPDVPKIDAKAVSKFIGKYCFVLAAAILLIALSSVFKSVILHYAGIGLGAFATVFSIAYMNMGNKFQIAPDPKAAKKAEKAMQKKAKSKKKKKN